MASFQTDIVEDTQLIWKPFPFLPDGLALKCKGSQNLFVATSLSLQEKKMACLQEVSSPGTDTFIFKQGWTTDSHLYTLDPIRLAQTASDEQCWKHLAF